MNIGAVTPSNIATAVWTAATRNLTRLGPTLVTVTQTTNTTIAAAGSVDLRPAAGITRKAFVGCKSGAGTGIQPQSWDGTVTYFMGSPGTGNGVSVYVGAGGSSVGLRLLNTDGAQSGSYAAYVEDWVV